MITTERSDRAAANRRLEEAGLTSVETFRAAAPFNAERPDTLVVYCSDGRWRAQIEEFVCAQCSEQADIYAVPGGPAGFNLWGSSHDEAKVSEQAVRFLREHHELQTAWLIAHEGCAYYSSKYGPLEAKYIRQRQLEDLDRARSALLRWHPELEVNTVFAFLDAGRVAFAQLPPAM